MYSSEYIDKAAMSLLATNIILVILLAPFQLSILTEKDREYQNDLLNSKSVITNYPDLTRINFLQPITSALIFIDFIASIFMQFGISLQIIFLSFVSVINAFLAIPYNLGVAWVIFNTLIIGIWITNHAQKIVDMVNSVIEAFTPTG